MKSINLPAGTEFLPFNVLEHYIAAAIHPEADEQPERAACAWQLERDLMRDVKNGLLQLRHPVTNRPLQTGAGYVAQSQSVVTVEAFRKYVADQHCLAVIVNEPEAAPLAVTAVALGDPPGTPLSAEIDYSVLATREQLISAFGPFTGMDMSWFENTTDKPKLLAARAVAGKPGRNGYPPLFYPYKVMQWLVHSNRRRGGKISKETAWRMLKQHFPKVYAAYLDDDPNGDMAG